MYSEGRIRVNSTSGMIRSADRLQKKPQQIIGGKRLRLKLLSPRIVLARSAPTGRCCIFGAYSIGSWLTTLPPSSENLNDWRSIGRHRSPGPAFLISHLTLPRITIRLASRGCALPLLGGRRKVLFLPQARVSIME